MSELAHVLLGLLSVLLGLVLVGFAIFFLWVLPITLGVRCARRKNYSPTWMWFGIHPVGGWIAFLVLSCLTPRIACPNCGGYVTVNFRICPYCQGAILIYFQ